MDVFGDLQPLLLPHLQLHLHRLRHLLPHRHVWETFKQNKFMKMMIDKLLEILNYLPVTFLQILRKIRDIPQAIDSSAKF